MEHKNDEFNEYYQWEKNLLAAYRSLLKGSRETQNGNLQRLQSLHPAQNINLQNRFNGYARKFEKKTGSQKLRAGEDAERLRWMNLGDLYALCQYLGTTPDQLLLGKPNFVGQQVLDLVKKYFSNYGPTRFSAFISKIKLLNIPASANPYFFDKVLGVFDKTIKEYLANDGKLDGAGYTLNNAKNYFEDFDPDYHGYYLSNFYVFNLENIEDTCYSDLGIVRAEGHATENEITDYFLNDFAQRLKTGSLKFKDPQGKTQTGNLCQLLSDEEDRRDSPIINEGISKVIFWGNARKIQYKKLHTPLPQIYSMHFFYFLFRSGVYIMMNTYGVDFDNLEETLSDHPEIEDFLLFTFQNTFYNYYGNHWVWFNGLTDTTKKPD